MTVPITNLSLDEAKAVIDAAAKNNEFLDIRVNFAEGKSPFGKGIESWDILSTDGTIRRLPPTAVPWFPHEPSTWPWRYMTSKTPVALKKWNGQHPVEGKNTTEVTLPIGSRVKIVMASRFGDVGITDDLKAEHGYHARIAIEELEKQFEQFSMEP